VQRTERKNVEIDDSASVNSSGIFKLVAKMCVHNTILALASKRNHPKVFFPKVIFAFYKDQTGSHHQDGSIKQDHVAIEIGTFRVRSECDFGRYNCTFWVSFFGYLYISFFLCWICENMQSVWFYLGLLFYEG